MALPEMVTAQQWLTARRELLAHEKELTRRRDALNARRRDLPMVRVSEDYRFTGPDGEVGLRELFDGRAQLVVQHMMFDPDWDSACPGCTAGGDEIAEALLRHLNSRDTSFAAVSRAPYPKLAAWRAERGWPFGYYSSLGSSFNYDFHVTLDPSVAPVLYNYRDAGELRAAGLDWAADGPGEMAGVSCFLREGDEVFHTYSTFARGTEELGGAYSILDLTALGRQEEWEEPKGRVATPHGADPTFTD